MSDDDYKAEISVTSSHLAEEDSGDQSCQEKVKRNYVSGITVALVSVPLSTALAIAAGAKPMQGLSTAVYGPMIGGLFGGSNYNILGPAGALVNILNNYSTQYGPEIIPILAFFAGCMIMTVFLFRLEKYCMLIPVSVLEGFSVSVAISIAFSQFNFAFGLTGLKHHKELYLNTWETFSNLDKITASEFVPFLIMFITLMTLLKVYKGRPWLILIAIIGMVYGIITKELIPSIKPKLLGELYPEMKNPSLYDFSYVDAKLPSYAIIALGAFQVAFVGVLETLISARIADGLTGTRFKQN